MRICPKCDEEFPDTHSRCPVCDVELASSVAEDAPDLVVLCTVLDEAKAYIMRGFLESEGIPCQLENISFHAEPAPVADLMKVRLWTLREDAAQARELLEECENVRLCSACGEEVAARDEVCLHCGERLAES